MTHNQTGSIYAHRNDGLGARLIAIVDAMRLAQCFDVPLRIRWHQAEDIGASLNNPLELFDPQFVADHFVGDDEWADKNPGLYPLMYKLPMTSGAVRSILAMRQDVLVSSCFVVTSFDDEDAASVGALVRENWRHFPFSAAMRIGLAHIRQVIGDNATAFHIRRGDIVNDDATMNLHWPDKYVVDEIFEDWLLQAQGEGSRSILFSDDRDTIQKFQERFPELIPANTLLGPLQTTPAQRDFLEICAMSLCNRIIAPPESAFSTSAAALGIGQKINAVADLAEPARQDAGNRLFARLSTVGAAMKSFRPGELGHDLAYLSGHLHMQGQPKQAADLLLDYFKNGLDISFLYPHPMFHLLRDGDAGRAVVTGKTILGHNIRHHEDHGLVVALLALAQALNGDPAAAAKGALAAIWRNGDDNLTSEVIGLLLDSSILNAQNFLPTSPAALTLWRRPGTEIERHGLWQAVGDLFPSDADHTVPALQPLRWDWSPFFRTIPIGDWEKHPALPYLRDRFAALKQEQDSADLMSLETLFNLFAGNRADTLPNMLAASNRLDAGTIVQHRLSLAAWTLGKAELARKAAEAALEKSGNAPAHLAWRGMLRLQGNDPLGALDDLDTALQSGFVLPRIPQLLATAAFRAQRPDIERQSHDNGVALAPHDKTLRIARARFHVRMGNHNLAVTDLDHLDATRPGQPDVAKLRHEIAIAAGKRGGQ